MSKNTSILVAAILVAGILIAGTVALTNHWQITGESGSLFRLNLWTGEIALCQAVQSNAGNIEDRQRATVSMSCSAHVPR